MFAQQCALQGWLLGAFERMHAAAGKRSGAMKTAAAARIIVVIRAMNVPY